MKITKLSQIFLLLLASSAAALAAAYISQYIFDYQPCILCLYQRKPFFVIIAIAVAALFLKSFKTQQILFFSCLTLLAINFAIATYHVGVEQKIFRGPSTCSSENLNNITDLQELEKALKETKAIRCDEPSFFFLRLSMAAWNAIFCLTLAVTLHHLYTKNILQSRRAF